jgi:hypothetical protein
MGKQEGKKTLKHLSFLLINTNLLRLTHKTINKRVTTDYSENVIRIEKRFAYIVH